MWVLKIIKHDNNFDSSFNILQLQFPEILKRNIIKIASPIASTGIYEDLTPIVHFQDMDKFFQPPIHPHLFLRPTNPPNAQPVMIKRVYPMWNCRDRKRRLYTSRSLAQDRQQQRLSICYPFYIISLVCFLSVREIFLNPL